MMTMKVIHTVNTHVVTDSSVTAASTPKSTSRENNVSLETVDFTVAEGALL